MKRDPVCTRFLVLSIALAGLLLLCPTAGIDAWARSGGTAPALDCPPCDDGRACTIDSCNTSTGTCRHEPRSCDDGNPCTADTCVDNPPTGAPGCFNVSLGDGTSCDDGNACTGPDACSDGQCVGAPMHNNSDCDDGNSCTTRDRCNSTTGECVGENALPGTTCDDGTLCTTGDVCVAPAAGGIVCVGTVVDCDDGDACTVDTCDPATGACSNTPVDCNDGNVCTTDSCDPATGSCRHEPTPAPCEDGDSCTLFDMCNAGSCVPGSPKNCDDGNPCTTDSCNPSTGACVHAPASGPCNDGDPCTTGDSCNGGSCAGTPVDCSDQNVCTVDSCNGSTGACMHSPAPGQTCNDGDACTSGDTCVNGTCVGTSVSCDDGNACTLDACDSGTGACVHTPTNAPCNDGNACTTGETCATGTCGGGTPVTCGASSECFDNVCDPAVGCVVQPRIGAPCNGGNLCFSGTCSAGGCQVQTFLCDDHNVCTIDSCQDQATGACGHAPVSCDDGKSCTIDSCSPTLGCQHTFDANLPDTDLDGLPDSCDNCPTTANHFQDDCNGNGIGDSCDPSLFVLTVSTQSPLGKGSGTVFWSTVCEVDMRGFNVVMIDQQGGRTRLNSVTIPCESCITGLSASYSTLIPKHKSARNIFLEVLHRTSANLTVGPAVKE